MTAEADVGARIVERIRRLGPIPYADFVDLALYGEGGFYSTGGGAGRRRDFLTSPEVGPLFGAVVARALDTWWNELHRPDPFVVVEAAAGPGTLARAVLAAAPTCGPALRYVLVERSPALLAALETTMPIEPPALVLGDVGGRDDDGESDGPSLTGRGPLVTALAEMPAVPFNGVVLANELLDNLAFTLVQRTQTGWDEVRVGESAPGALVEVLVAAAPGLQAEADDLASDAVPGARIPIQHRAAAWVRDALGLVDRGRLVVIDYGRTSAEMATIEPTKWLRTYRAHERGSDPLDQPGQRDITCDVALDQLPGHPEVTTQADFLLTHGLAELVAEGKAIWAERAAIGDLAAMRARSRVAEAEALTDPDGLGGFVVAQWAVG